MSKKRTYRWIWIPLLVIVVIVISVRWILTTEWLHRTVVSMITESVPGLQIESSYGDLWNGATLIGVSYRDSSLTADIDTVHVQYSVWPLLRRTVLVDDLTLLRPRIAYVPIPAEPDTIETTGYPELPIDLDLRSILIRNGSVSFDGVPYVNELSISASATWMGTEPAVSIHELDFMAGGIALDSTSVSLRGDASTKRIQLDDLVIATGRSLIRSEAIFNLDDSSLQASTITEPLSWRDILALTESGVLKQDVSAQLDISGTLDNLTMHLFAEASGMSGFNLGLQLRVDDDPTLTNLTLQIAQLNLRSLFGDPSMPNIRSIEASFEGSVPLMRAEAGRLSGTLATRDIRLPDGRIGSTSINAELAPDYRLTYSATARQLQFDTQTIEQITATGFANRDSISSSGDVRIRENSIAFVIGSDWNRPDPTYALRLETTKFDMRQIEGYESFPTSLNLLVTARGRNVDLARARIDARLEVRNSIINRARVDSVTAVANLDRSILTITQGTIKSAIANGNITMRQDLNDPLNPANRLDASLTILNLQPLATLAGLETLQARGELNANLTRSAEGHMRFDGLVDLNDVRIDTIFIANVTGLVESDILTIPTFGTNLRLERVEVSGFDIPFAELRTEGRIHPDSVTAFYVFEARATDDITLRHEGDVTQRGTDIHIVGSHLDLVMAREPYRLSHPFTFDITETGLRLADFEITGNSGALVRIDASQQSDSLGLDFLISNADFAVISQILDLEEPITGRLNVSGDVRYQGEEPEFTISGYTDEFNILTVNADSLWFDVSLVDAKLDLVAGGLKNQTKWLDINISAPFLFQDPTSLDEDFFTLPISGSFQLARTDLSEFPGLFQSIGFEPIPGFFRTKGTLGGTAGDPRFSGELHLTQSNLSSVPVDSLGLSWAFDSRTRSVQLESKWISLGQTALDISGRLPFDVDMRRMVPVVEPELETIQLSMLTQNFNINAFNLFLDPATARRLRGFINGDLKLTGSYSNPDLAGSVKLTRGSVFLPEQNITLSNMGFDLNFVAGRIDVNRISLQSNGTVSATGTVNLDGVIPSSFDLTLKGTNLQISDTREQQIFVSMDNRLRGTFENPHLTGSLRLERGYLYLDNFGDNSVEDVLLEDETEPWLDSVELYENLAMELRFSTERNFWVRNRSQPELNLELRGELDILKEKGGELSVFGTMGTNQGNVTQLGKRFTLEEGNLMFSGNPSNPDLQIRTLYELRPPHDISIWYIISGTLEKPVPSFESDPEMEEQDIVSYTLFSRPFQQLMAWEQTMSGSSNVGNIAVDMLVDRVGDLAANTLGLDVIEIDNSRSSGNTGTSIKAGKFINDRLFVAILQELGSTSDSQVIIEYALRQNLNLIVTGSDKRKSGVDIQWKYDY
jgi:autotransporter translocation and assembly factor TamB